MALPIYLDYMATTPLDPRVLRQITDCLGSADSLGNASSQNHCFGSRAAALIEAARQSVADLIHANPREMVWVSGATEADNLALKGAALFYQRKGRHIITMQTEHKAVLNTCAYLESIGFTVSYLRPTAQGLLDIEEFRAAIRPDTILASIMWVNSETGVIQDIAALSQITRENGIILHVDAAQAVGKIPVDVQSLPVDLLSLSAHKFYGPKGIGALYVRRTPRIRLAPQIHGGEQERGLRSGTLPTHQIVGMGAACALAKAELTQDQQHARALGARLWEGLQKLSGVELNGDFERRIPHCLNVSIRGIEADILLPNLTDLALSTGSACHFAHTTPSHVLTAMGIRAERARSALRISFGRFTCAADIERAITTIGEQVLIRRRVVPL